MWCTLHILIITIYSRVIETLYEFPGRVRIISEDLGISTQQVYSTARAHCFGLKWIIKSQVGHALLLSESGEQEICINIRKIMAINNASGSYKIRGMIDEYRYIKQKLLLNEHMPWPASDSYVQGLLLKNNLTLAQPSRLTTDRNDEVIRNDDEVNLDFDIGCLVCKEVGAKRTPATTKENASGQISTVITIMTDGPSPSQFFILGSTPNVPKYLQVLIEYTGVGTIANRSGWMIKDVMRIFARILRDWVRKMRKLRHFKKNEQILFFMRSYTSRDDLDAVTTLAEERITLITFPEAIAHIILPVDRIIAREFRKCFRKLLHRFAERARNEIISCKLSTAIKRELIVQAAFDAYQQSIVATSRWTEFFSTSLWPRSSLIACQSRFVIDDSAAPRHPEGRKTSRKTASARSLTKELCPDKIKRKRSPQEVQNGSKIRRLNSAEQRSQECVSKQLQEEKNNDVDSTEWEDLGNEGSEEYMGTKLGKFAMDRRDYAYFPTQEKRILCSGGEQRKCDDNVEENSILRQISAQQLIKSKKTVIRRGKTTIESTKFENEAVSEQITISKDNNQEKKKQSKENGNCYFMAVSHQLYETNKLHRQLRVTAVKELIESKEKYQEEFEDSESLKEYTEKTNCEGEFADARINLPICQSQKVNLRNYLGNNHFETIYINVQKQVEIAYVDRINYVSVV
ncbi:MAG: hypothetical protein EZS28_014607 [Streblomastix strix]|uniref:OTU domain-containing protein n=1 Tax=Streblomastix strix TaxID=222440 RepID=A0A5J4W4P0_9EUKA|nr:MAG: hypothetical protein EZS28_014607 [Streblomastix strix]